ncbi:MAG: phosphoenolpyruvate--protein phosphotransferase [Verrucomicrobia bacterium]|nr:phosphoenolpyruvate--protein phosphotransferase [Verrucomicrobiota bacterium]
MTPSDSPPVPGTELRLAGIPASPGVVSGQLAVFAHEEVRIHPTPIQEDQIDSEMRRLEAALLKTREQIQKIKEQLAHSIGEQETGIFEAHLLVAGDSTIVSAVRKQLQLRKICVEHVYQHVIHTYAQSLRQVEDPYLRERAADILDVGRRVVHNLLGRKLADIYALDAPSIILAHDLSPSDTALLNRQMALGFATEAGSTTSHTAIMARSLNIPAVVGLHEVLSRCESGAPVILDGYSGLLIVHPSEQTRYEYGQIEKRRHEVEQRLEALRDTPADTTDGRHIILSANVELPEDLPLIAESGAEGIGLYRTEFMFLNRVQFPGEDEQMNIYRQVVQASRPHLAIIRTLDLGGDKLPTHQGLDPEANPFLGWRAIRYCLERPEIFKVQLRAICRSNPGGKIRVMFPMIATREELAAALTLLREAREELKAAGIPAAEEVEAGAMIEVPSAALIAERLAPMVQFFSIGTNDLTQYTMAADRTNERVASLYQPTHPGVLSLIRRVVEAARNHGIWVGVCGEMASDVVMTPALVGLGVDEMSMGSVSVPRVKKAIQSLSFAECEALALGVLQMDSGEEVRQQLEKVAQQKYPELVT